LVSAQEMTKDELISAYEKSFANLHSWDIIYTAGHVAHWEGWKTKPNTNLQPSRWRKSGNIERRDSTEHVGDVPILRDGSNKRTVNEPVVMRDMLIPSYAQYTDEAKLWRFSGDLGRTENVDLLDERRGHGEIRLMPDNAVWSEFPYHSFYFSLSIDKDEYTIPQVLRELRTEIVDRKQNGNNIILTTRSYLPSASEDPKQFIQISFDSSVGYNPRQIVIPLDSEIRRNVPSLPYYRVRDFIEYHASDNGAFFPVKIIASQTDDINKLEGLEPIGKTAALSIILNQPVDVPAIEFPPGAIVVIEDAGNHTPYIWGENNEPLKVLTEADYEEAARKRSEPLPPKEHLSTTQIIFIVLGIIMIIAAFVLRWLRQL